MTIDEAIAHERELAKRNRILLDPDELVQKSYDAYFDKLKCKKCAEEHEQLSEWLEELKCCKNDKDFSDYADRLHKIAFNSGYNKALEDFAGKIKSNARLGYVGYLDKIVDEIEEQLKVGGENEN